jgi:hypothetical protein
MPEKIAYTPAEFAALFGKERTWGYRQIYAGKVDTVTVFGSIMIPAKEVEKAMGQASRYGVSGNAIKRSKRQKATRRATKERNSAWKKHLSHQRQSEGADNSQSDGMTTSAPTYSITRGPQDAGLILRRLTKGKRISS